MSRRLRSRPYTTRHRPSLSVRPRHANRCLWEAESGGACSEPVASNRTAPCIVVRVLWSHSHANERTFIDAMSVSSVGPTQQGVITHYRVTNTITTLDDHFTQSRVRSGESHGDLLLCPTSVDLLENYVLRKSTDRHCLLEREENCRVGDGMTLIDMNKLLISVGCSVKQVLNI